MEMKAYGLIGAIIAIGWASPVLAQDDLTTLSITQLRGELESRYNSSLAATSDPAVIAANDTRYVWAREAATQCGIAIGFTKGGIKDKTSIDKCASAYQRSQGQPPVAIGEVPAPLPIPDVCNNHGPRTIFFEFDADTFSTDGQQTVEYLANNLKTCSWPGLVVVGHTDRAGSNAYNDALAARRADNVANALASLGVDRSLLSVSSRGENDPAIPTVDGERNPQNRRVAISVK